MKIFIKFFIVGLGLLFLSACEHLTTPFGPDTSTIVSDSSSLNVSTLLFEDFDGGGISPIYTILADISSGGNSTISNWKTHDAAQGSNAMLCRYHFVKSSLDYRFARLDVWGEQDLRKYNAVSFKLKGSGNKLRITLTSYPYQTETAFGDGAYNNYGYLMNATPSEWTTYTIKLSDFVQENWGGKGEDMDYNEILRQFTTISFCAYSFIDGETGWFMVDDIKFLYLVDKR